MSNFDQNCNDDLQISFDFMYNAYRYAYIIIQIRTQQTRTQIHMNSEQKHTYSEYSDVINYGVECMQQGRFRQARLAFLKAIRNIDCYCYIGYYNMFVIECFRLDACGMPGSEKQIQQSSQTKASILQYLYLALSCLYQQLGRLTSDAKFCVKSLSLCQSNSQAYLTRACIFQQDQKLTLAQNDYSSAVYYATPSSICYFVMKRAQFYWRIDRISEANQDVKLYWENKVKEQNIQSEQLKAKPVTESDVTNFQSVIAERSFQLSDLLQKLKLITGSTITKPTFKAPKSPKSVVNMQKQIQLAIKQQNLAIKATPELDNVNKQSEIQIDNIIKQQAQLASSTNKQINRQEPQQAIIEQQQQAYLDQSSKNISQQIQRLQNEIKIARGRMSIYQSQSQSHSQGELSNQINLLSAEIECTSKDIQNMKKLQLASNSKSNSKTDNVIPITNIPQILAIHSHTIPQQVPESMKIDHRQTTPTSSQPWRLSQQQQQVQEQKQQQQKELKKINRLSTSSANSKYSQKFIALQQLQNYTKIIIQIVSAQFFDSNNKQQCKVYLNYGNQRGQTESSKNNFWRHKFMFAIQHQLHKAFQSQLQNFQDIDFNADGDNQGQINNYNHVGQINVQLEMKSKSIWSSKRIIGRSSINIQRAGQHKCILSNEKQKTGIVYFKIKLE